MTSHLHKISQSLKIHNKQVEATIKLLEEGATVPFISRYRKEATGSLDEMQVTAIRDLAKLLNELDKRKETILKSITEQGKLTTELEKKIATAETLAALEDIYLPYKLKRKTRASVAREKGLEPLALQILGQKLINLEDVASKFTDGKQVENTEEALAGARNIIAEMVSEDADGRERMRRYFIQKSQITSKVAKGKAENAIKYKDYFEWAELAKNAPSHRLLAMFRGEEEGMLKIDLLPDEADALLILEKQWLKSNNSSSKQVEIALIDGYKRLLRPAMETELRTELKRKADEEAIKVFANNARQLLMAAPLGQKNVLAIDPGFRTGCKVVCLDKQGNLLDNFTIFPHNGQAQLKDAENKLRQYAEKYKIEAIAIGNGTAGRETETFVHSAQFENIIIVMVNESGASIYSASTVAREEFPDKDITVRGAVSIGRRLIDPLAELVKIDPKSIGVGQYQHDVDQGKLQQSLDDTVMSCVNAVGVELNTASKQILTYISGLGAVLAQNIVDYRAKNGAFKNRESLKKVPRLGEKAYEQAAGFLRIHQAQNPLDTSGVHPERYDLVHQMAKDLGVSIHDLMQKPELQKQINLQKYSSAEVGLPTLKDILNELAKPGRDPREQFEVFSFADGVNTISDLKIGMELKGIVTNITNFGAFVDIGVHQDGLVHTSQLANRFVSNPNEVVKVGQIVKVSVTEVDAERKRISLSMKDKKQNAISKKPKEHFNKPKFQDTKNTSKTTQTKEADGDLQAQLAKLKGKFRS